MTLLLDTHVALWAITADATLGDELLDRLRHDPFDRRLVAQAACEALTLASRDQSIALYDIDILTV